MSYIKAIGSKPLLFYTSALERMRVDSSGNVGISYTGTPSMGGTPFTKITQIGGGLRLGDTTASTQGDGCIQLGTGGYVSSNVWDWGTIIGLNLATKINASNSVFYTPQTHPSIGYSGVLAASSGNILFYTFNGATTAGATITPTVRMTLDASGNVGIGVSPATAANRIHTYTNGDSSIKLETISSNAYDNSIEFKKPTHSWYIGGRTTVDSTAFGIGPTSAKDSILINTSNKIGFGLPAIGSYSLWTYGFSLGNGFGIGLLKGSSTDNAYIHFGYGTTSPQQQLCSLGNISDALVFFTNSGVERMRISSTGAVTVASGGSILCPIYTSNISATAQFDVSPQAGYSHGIGAVSSILTTAAYVLVIISEVLQTGAGAVYLCTNGSVTLISGLGSFIAPTTTPGVNQFSVQWNSSALRVYSNQASLSVIFKATILRHS